MSQDHAQQLLHRVGSLSVQPELNSPCNIGTIIEKDGIMDINNQRGLVSEWFRPAARSATRQRIKANVVNPDTKIFPCSEIICNGSTTR